MPTYMAQLAFDIERNPAPWGDYEGSYSYHSSWSYFHDKLKERKLYTFSRSAVSAAADIRISSARRLEAMIWALAQTDRSIFIEARAKDINDHLSPLHEAVEIDGAQEYFLSSSIERVGYFIDVNSTEIRIEAHSLCTTEFADSIMENDYGNWPKPSLKRLFAALRLAPDGNVITVKPAAQSVSKKAFITQLSLVGIREKGPLRSDWLDADTPRERKQRIEEAWWVQRYHDMIADEDIEDESLLALSFPQLAPITTASIALSMLAALDASGDGIEVTDLPSAKRRRPKKDKRSRPTVSEEGSLRLVTLNLNDRALERAYEVPRESSKARENDSVKTGGGARSRHPVRGHLFLARNGKITWRKPHWRGSGAKHGMTRVIKR
jgi:hypothetical protein